MFEALDWGAIFTDFALYTAGILTAIFSGKFKKK